MATTGSSSSSIETLPEDCVSQILSHTSPPDACRFSMLSSTLCSASGSDALWRSFLPSDYSDIISRSLNPTLPLNDSSGSYYKHLFKALCHPLLLHGGNMSFKLDKSSGKKSYILSARELSITWSSDPMYWTWKPMPESRFREVAELRTVSWLEIEGKIRTQILTPNTLYVVYLIMKVSNRGYGLDFAPCEVSVAVANQVVQSGKVYLWQKDEQNKCDDDIEKHSELIQQDHQKISIPSKRDDGWMEIEVGEFYCGEGVDDEVKMKVMEVGYQLKGGLIVEGIEVRPKQV